MAVDEWPGSTKALYCKLLRRSPYGVEFSDSRLIFIETIL